MSKNTFQVGVVGPSREKGSSIYIGSTDVGTKGYFIIETEGAAEVMQAWYDQRIAKENLHLENLHHFVETELDEGS